METRWDIRLGLWCNACHPHSLSVLAQVVVEKWFVVMYMGIRPQHRLCACGCQHQIKNAALTWTLLSRPPFLQCHFIEVWMGAESCFQFIYINTLTQTETTPKYFKDDVYISSFIAVPTVPHYMCSTPDFLVLHSSNPFFLLSAVWCNAGHNDLHVSITEPDYPQVNTMLFKSPFIIVGPKNTKIIEVW